MSNHYGTIYCALESHMVIGEVITYKSRRGPPSSSELFYEGNTISSICFSHNHRISQGVKHINVAVFYSLTGLRVRQECVQVTPTQY